MTNKQIQRVPTLGNLLKNSVGFDKFFDMLNESINDINACTYPPYNILKVGDTFRIEIAVAGFARDEISATIEDGVLVIAGESKVRAADPTVEVLHQGIALRKFDRRFRLSDQIDVSAVSFRDGLLVITLSKKPEPEKKIQTLNIE